MLQTEPQSVGVNIGVRRDNICPISHPKSIAEQSIEPRLSWFLLRTLYTWLHCNMKKLVLYISPKNLKPQALVFLTNSLSQSSILLWILENKELKVLSELKVFSLYFYLLIAVFVSGCLDSQNPTDFAVVSSDELSK